MTTTLVSILIASIGRPSLLTTLDSISRARLPAGTALEIIIADDSSDGAVPARLADYTTSLAIRTVAVGARNVAIARNAGLDAARGDWLLLVDDDEYVDPDWIAAHLAAARTYAADVVFGPVYPVYPEGTPDWVRAANPMFHDMGWSTPGKTVDFGQSGNTLIRADLVRRLDIRFDPEFGRSGGEDNDFFRRLARRGARLVVTDTAKAWETVPADRIRTGYLLQRMVRTGRIYANLALRGVHGPRRLAFALDALVKLLVATGGAIAFLPIDRTRAFRLRMKASSNLGKLSALFGARPTAAWS